MDQLPVELVHMIVFEFSLAPKDVLNLCLCSQQTHALVLGSNDIDRDKHRALAGTKFCWLKGWVRSLLFALKLDPFPDHNRYFAFFVTTKYMPGIKWTLSTSANLYMDIPMYIACRDDYEDGLDVMLKSKMATAYTIDKQYKYCISENKLRLTRIMEDHGRQSPQP